MYNKKQRIAAILGIVLLVLLYLVTLICAIFNFDGTGRLFQACLFATIAVPILLWIYIWLYGKMTNKHTMADFDLGSRADSAPDHGENVDEADADKELVTLSKRGTKSTRQED